MTQYQYDKNSNITHLVRWGFCYEDDEFYDTADDVHIAYVGNQKKSLSNYGFEADYYGGMQCADAVDEPVEYAYDGNGNMTRDDNKGMTFEYDLLGHPLKVNGPKSTIEYVYAPDGRKLRAKHKIYTSTTKKTIKTSTIKDYTNGYIYTNGKPSMYSFDGGYYSFDNQGKLNGCHYYISDYQGNNRMVVNAATNATEQVNHYYPYGALMGNISTKPDAQQFKYGGKELDLSDGLDLYDFEARQQDPVSGDFTSIDPLAATTPQYSPYTYCGGNPINGIDPNGKKTIWINGFTPFSWEQGSESYWPKEALENAAKLWGEPIGTFEFKDGSLGGLNNIVHQTTFLGSLCTPSNLVAENRFDAGYNQGIKDAPRILCQLKRDKDYNVVEALRIVTHSMGGAYGHGYLNAILKYAKKYWSAHNGLVVSIYDFSPFQSKDIKDKASFLGFQYHHLDDKIAPNDPIDGETQCETDKNTGGHTIGSYNIDFTKLNPGTYKFIDGELVKVK